MREEAKRLAVISELKIAGTRGPSSIRRICEMAADLCDAAMSAITVVDETHCWFYAENNIALRFVPRDRSLCERAIRDDEPFVLDDMSTLPDAVDLMPGVACGAYLAAPIIYKPGVRIGSICVIDAEPRSFTDEQKLRLQQLSEFVVEALRLEQVILSQQNMTIEAFEAKALLEQQNTALEIAKTDMELAADLANVGFWSYDIQTQAFDVSKSMRRIVDADDRDTPAIVMSLLRDQKDGVFQKKISECSQKGESFDQKTQVFLKSGEQKWLRSVGRAEIQNGKAVRVRGCTQDISTSVRDRGHISKLAALDTLTGVHNRRFLPMAYMKLRRETSFDLQKITFLLIDLDHFKAVNDTKGHDAGDEVLVAVAKILRSALREGDVVGRLGGDEFMLILRGDRDIDIGAVVSERLAEQVRASAILQQFTTPISLSIGYIDITDDHTEFADALKSADLAVYEAKRRGRDCAVGYRADLGDASERRSQVLSEIEGALREERIFPAYQAKIDLQNRTIIGFEALARWRHPERGVLAPGAFFEALEHPTYSRRISDAVLTQTVRDLRRFADLGSPGLQIAVNLTETQLVDEGFPQRLAALCEQHGVEPRQLGVEITEQILLTRQSDRIRETLSEISALGIDVAFDDFGTGFASLTHLREFEIDVIKIDRSFVSDLVTNATTRAITASVVQMAKGLDAFVVAEGIETEDVERVLVDMGCQIGQGFLYSKAIPFDEAVVLLGAWSRGETDDGKAVA